MSRRDENMKGDPAAERQALVLLLESSLDAMYVVDDEGRVRYWTWGAEQMFGFSKSEAMGRSIYELTVPFDRRDEWGRMVKEARETGSALGDTTRRRKDQAPIQVQTMMRSVAGAGGGQVFAISDKDVTEHKRFEQTVMEQIWSLTGVQTFLQSILDGTKDYSILAVDLEGRIQEWNAGATRDFGYTTDDVKGQSFHPLLVAPEDPDGEQHKRALETALQEGRFEGEFLAVRRDGSRFPARTTINVRKGPYDDAIGFIVILRDVTEERRIEKERELARERLAEIRKLEEVSRLKTRILNTASHELNTPLTPIRMQMHMLSSGALGPLDERHQKAFEVLERNFQRLTGVVQMILDVSRIQSEELSLSRTPVDLSAFVGDALASLAHVAERGGITLEGAPEGGLVVHADATRLQQVLGALLDNALKFTPRGGRVRLTAFRDRDQAIIRVEDTGVGLSPAQMEHLFEPFGQAHDTMQRTDSGAGFGLFLARGIVEAHGGRIWVESGGPGKGSTFSFSLPLGDASKAQAATPAKGSVSGANPVHGG